MGSLPFWIHRNIVYCLAVPIVQCRKLYTNWYQDYKIVSVLINVWPIIEGGKNYLENMTVFLIRRVYWGQKGVRSTSKGSAGLIFWSKSFVILYTFYFSECNISSRVLFAVISSLFRRRIMLNHAVPLDTLFNLTKTALNNSLDVNVLPAEAKWS